MQKQTHEDERYYLSENRMQKDDEAPTIMSRQGKTFRGREEGRSRRMAETATARPWRQNKNKDSNNQNHSPGSRDELRVLLRLPRQERSARTKERDSEHPSPFLLNQATTRKQHSADRDWETRIREESQHTSRTRLECAEPDRRETLSSTARTPSLRRCDGRRY